MRSQGRDHSNTGLGWTAHTGAGMAATLISPLASLRQEAPQRPRLQAGLGRRSLNQLPSGVQLRRRRATRLSVLSPSKLLGDSASSDLSTLSKVLTFTTAYRAPSITHVTIGTIPHVLHTWKSAVCVPNRYWPDWEAFPIAIRNRPSGCDVQTPRCFLQCSQLQARTGIVCPGPGQSSVNRMLPQ
jgi:hypothetical protein